MKNVLEKMQNYERRMASIDIRKPAARRTPASTPKAHEKYDGIYTRRPKYCHTCGINPWHHSENCSIGCPGHKSEASMEDKMGGNTTNHMKKKE